MQKKHTFAHAIAADNAQDVSAGGAADRGIAQMV